MNGICSPCANELRNQWHRNIAKTKSKSMAKPAAGKPKDPDTGDTAVE